MTSLKRFNTLALDAHCEQVIEITEFDQLRTVLSEIQKKSQRFLILGSGSNLVLSQDFPGIVLHIAIQGIDLLEQDKSSVTLSVSAGEDWDKFVGYCVGQGYFGLENLSGIPGTVGAAPVQNIGAYGVELEQLLVSVEALEIETGILRTFSHDECGFAYRDSLFKRDGAGRYVITQVVLKLSKGECYQGNLSYKGLQDEFNKRDIGVPNPSLVRSVIKEVRNGKLPDPAVLANAGSFFKNPIVTEPTHSHLLEHYPTIASFPLADGQVKLAASWMIEQAGWKGFREGDAGVFEHHALILVNHDDAKGADILSLASQIQDSVLHKFNVRLEIEPLVV